MIAARSGRRRTRRANEKKRWKIQWRAELIERFKMLRNLVIDADAFQSAFEAIYGETAWPRNKDPERRRALNRMSCFVTQLRNVLDDLLHESHEAVALVIKRSRSA